MYIRDGCIKVKNNLNFYFLASLWCLVNIFSSSGMGTGKDAIILDGTDAITTTRDTATNTISNEQEVDDVSELIERKFNDLSDKVEKRLQNIEDQIIDMQLSNLSGNNVSGKAVTSENFLHVDILKNRILELEKQLSEKNTIIDFLTKQLFANSHDISKGKCSHNIIERNCIDKDKNNMTLYMKKKALKIYQTK